MDQVDHRSGLTGSSPLEIHRQCHNNLQERLLHLHKQPPQPIQQNGTTLREDSLERTETQMDDLGTKDYQTRMISVH